MSCKPLIKLSTDLISKTLLLSCVSCASGNQTGLSITTTSAPASPSPSLSPAPSISAQIPEIRSDGRICEPLPTPDKLPTQLRYPIDLAVTANGQDIYIIGKHCDDPISQKSFLNQFNFTDCGNKPNAANTVPRSYIYHLKPDQGLEILKIDGHPPLSCELGEDLEIDSQGRIYVTTPYNHRIYRIDPKQGKLEQIVEARQAKLTVDSTAEPDHVLSGPAYLYLFEDQVYFSLEESQPTLKPERHIGRVEPENRHRIIETYTHEILDSYPNFMVAEGMALGPRKYVYIYTQNSELVPIISASLNPKAGSAMYLVFNPLRPVGYELDPPPLGQVMPILFLVISE